MSLYNRPKYIIYHDLEHDMELPIIFPNCLVHLDVAKRLKGRVVSAGFVVIDPNGDYKAFGRSESIGCSSREEDSDILGMYLTA